MSLSMRILITLALVPVFVHAEKTKTFIYCSEGSPSNFNPQLIADAVTANTTFPVYDRLLVFERGGTKPVGALAESWEPAKDGLSYTFHLRKDVSFQKRGDFAPTRKMNADDVIFSIDRQRLKDHPFHAIGGGKYEFWESLGMNEAIKSIDKIDDYTVRINLTQPNGAFVADMAMPFMSIFSVEYAEYLKKKGTPEKIDFEPLGTGPFIWTSYVKDQTIRYKANTDYWKGKPKIDALVFSITPDAGVRYHKLKAGECNFISQPPVPDLEAMKKDSNIQLMSRPGMNVGYVALNTTKPLLDKPAVRRAIYYAMNRQSYIDATYLGHAVVAKNPLPPAQWGYNKSIKDYEYDPQKAKALLKEAGLPNGFDIELWAQPVSRPYNPNGKKMAEMMQADLAKVGIRAKIISFDWPTYLSKARNGEHSMLQLGWTTDNGDPDCFMYGLLSCSGIKGGSNHSRWCYEPLDKLVVDARKLTKQADRVKLYEKAQVIFHDQVPWVPVANSILYKALSKNVTGYQFDAMGYDFLDEVDLK